MQLRQILEQLDGKGKVEVPGWLPGCFRRQYIHYYDGKTDSSTRVFWLQSGGLTIDLRLPGDANAVEEPELRYQGWCADSLWRQGRLSWENFTSLHQRDLWPEPAILHRVGLHLIEQAPSGVYLEDWLALQATPGPLAGFRLQAVQLPGERHWRGCGGALIVAGDWAGWVLDARDFGTALQPLPPFISRIARASSPNDFPVLAALDSQAVGKPLLPSGEFQLEGDLLLQRMQLPDGEVRLRYGIDQVDMRFDFAALPPAAPSGLDWYRQELGWLGRR